MSLFGLEATHESIRGPLKGTVSAQKDLQGSETETKELLGGTGERNIIHKEGTLICPSCKSMIFYKKETEKRLVAWPETTHRNTKTGLKSLVGGDWPPIVAHTTTCSVLSELWAVEVFKGQWRVKLALCVVGGPTSFYMPSSGFIIVHPERRENKMAY